MPTENKKPPGGKRPGAGRPQLDPLGHAISVSVSVPPAVAHALEAWRAAHGLSRSAAVTRALTAAVGQDDTLDDC